MDNVPLLIHLDLKGAPPSVTFVEELFKWIQNKLPVAGILLEYEDQFPFQNDRIRCLRNPNSCWGIEEIKRLLQFFHHHQLQVIPLIQTLGHMEYVLKHEQFKNLRELPEHPECLSPALTSESLGLELLRTMFSEVIACHGECISAIHLGGDEAWHLGQGDDCQRFLQGNPGTSKADLFMIHMTHVVTMVKEIKPDLDILIWDDMMRTIPVNQLQQYSHLTKSISPVVWQYTTSLQFPSDMWSNYQQCFSDCFIASAFKGASSSCGIIPPIRHHINNHLAWSSLSSSHEGKMPKIKGVILTAWQRFDHFATLCELLPTSIPSLICSMLAFKNSTFTDATIEQAGHILGLKAITSIDGQADPHHELAQQDAFPGAQIFLITHRLMSVVARTECHVNGDYVKTWCSPWHRQTSKMSKLHSKYVMNQCHNLNEELERLSGQMETALQEIYPIPVVTEWMECHVCPTRNKLTQLMMLCQNKQEPPRV